MKKLSMFAVMALILAGCSDSDKGIWSDLGDPGKAGESVYSAHKLGLTKANTCNDYRSHLLDAAAAEITQWRFEPYRYWINEAEADMSGSADGGDTPKGESAGEFTTTNVQEEAVDEADIVKNDGEWMYVLRGSEVRVLKAWPAENMSEVHRIDLGDGYGRGMFLSNGKLVVMSQDYVYWNDRNYRSAVKVNVYDVKNPQQPVLIHEHRIEGYYTHARMVDGRVFIVVDNWISAYDWEDVDGEIPGVPDYKPETLDKLTDAERKKLIETYTPVVRAYLEKKAPSIESLNFPKYSDGSVTRNAVDCEHIYIPNTAGVERGILIVAEISGDDFGQYASRAVADGGWTVYASTNNIYLVSTSSNWYWSCWDDENAENECRNYSQIHRFAIKNGLNYVASGEVEGYVSDSYWMSEYDGYLRVASDYLRNWSNKDGSALSVLDVNTMKQVGQVTGIAPNEEIYAARMFGNKGYMVTFRNTDPLFTIDLSNPAKPEIKGELKINGYSSYIHPLGDDALLTVGRDGDENGNIRGVQLQIFDVSDLSNPTQIHKQLITKDNEDSYSYSEALWDTHAFMYHAGSGLLSLPINMYRWSWSGGKDFSGAVVYRATKADGFKLVGIVNHADLMPSQDSEHGYYRWWTQLDRSRFMFKTAGVYDKDAYLYTVSDVGVKASNALKPSETFSSLKFGD